MMGRDMDDLGDMDIYDMEQDEIVQDNDLDDDGIDDRMEEAIGMDAMDDMDDMADKAAGGFYTEGGFGSSIQDDLGDAVDDYKSKDMRQRDMDRRDRDMKRRMVDEGGFPNDPTYRPRRGRGGRDMMR